ncbi:MAG: hypothetical protein Q9160_004632 [Pyrenula sp. 1 TL-2023]
MLAAEPFSILDTFGKINDAIDVNAVIADEIVSCALSSFDLSLHPKADSERDWRDAATQNDIAKAHSTIRQLYRDWSDEGLPERQACYRPVLADLNRAFEINERRHVNVLVPGAGLGRLVFEICSAGFTVEGNEISWHQLLTSSWILNQTKCAEQYSLFPFALQFTNLISRDHQLHRVQIPDIHPGTSLIQASDCNPQPGEMNMTAADFVAYYSSPTQHSRFNAVVTVFFIDTAPNIVRYIETVKNCLKVGGLWINLGPLHWHFDSREPGTPSLTRQKSDKAKTDASTDEHGSFELSNEELFLLMEKMGFRIEEHEISSQSAGYVQNPHSMLQDTFRVSHWMARNTK